MPYDDLALAIKKLTSYYDNLFQCLFPYSMGWHYAPLFTEGTDIDHWQLHALFYPLLLHSASVRNCMPDDERLVESQWDFPASRNYVMWEIFITRKVSITR